MTVGGASEGSFKGLGAQNPLPRGPGSHCPKKTEARGLGPSKTKAEALGAREGAG